MNDVPTWIDALTAADEYYVELSLITRLVKTKLVRTTVVAGKLHLASEDLKPLAAQLQPEQFTHLENRYITLQQAGRIYGFSYQVLWQWVRQGHIHSQRHNRHIYARESDIAYIKTLTTILGGIKHRQAVWPDSPQFAPISARGHEKGEDQQQTEETLK